MYSFREKGEQCVSCPIHELLSQQICCLPNFSEAETGDGGADLKRSGLLMPLTRQVGQQA